MRKTYTLLAAALLVTGSYAGTMLFQEAKNLPQLLSSDHISTPASETSLTTLYQGNHGILNQKDIPLSTEVSGNWKQTPIQISPENDPAIVLLPKDAIPQGSLVQLPDNGSPMMRQAAGTDANWTEWTAFGKTSFNGVLDYIAPSLEANGDTWPTWEEPFSVMRRHNADNPDQVQFRFDNIFNGVNIVMDWDAKSKLLFMEDQSTGIAQSGYTQWGANGYPEYMLRASGNAQNGCGTFYPATGTFRFHDLFLLVSSDYGGYGYNLGSCSLTLDGSQPLEFNLRHDSGSMFYPASVDQASFTVSRSAQVKSYRVAVFPDHTSIYYSTINDLSSSTPSGSYPYTDYTSENFSVNFTGYSTRYWIMVFPLGDDGSAIDSYTRLTCYSNRQEPHEWVSLGTGELTDVVGHVGVPYENLYDDQGNLLIAPASRQVQVDVRKDNPSIFRIHNPFGQGYPLLDKIHPTTTDNENFYVIVDATDPSRVKIPYALSGISDSFGYPMRINCCYTNYGTDIESFDQSSGNLWGKYSDAKISFPAHSVFLGNAHILTTPDFDFELRLPGYVEYLITLKNHGIPDEEDRYSIVMSENLKSVDCALVPFEQYQKYRDFPELLCKLVTDNTAGMVIKNYPATDAEAIIPARELIGEDYAEGEYHLVAVPRDADGHPHAGLVSDRSITTGGWSRYYRLGSPSEYAIVSLSGFGIDNKQVPAYVSYSTTSEKERYQFGDYNCPTLNGDPSSWISYINDYNFTVVREAERATDRPHLFYCTLQPSPTGDTQSFGEMIMICDTYTYVTQINPSALPEGTSPENFRRMSYLDSETGLITLNCVYYIESRFITQAYETMQLPGVFCEYDMAISYNDEYFEDADGQLKATINATRSKDVAYYLVDNLQGSLSGNDLSYAYNNLILNDDATRHTDTSAAITVNAFPGNNTAIAVGFNAAGRAVSMVSTQFRIDLDGKNWRSAGHCTYTDGYIYGLGLSLGDEIIGGDTWNVDLEEDITTPGRYRLVNPYNSWPTHVEYDHAWSLPGDYYIILNAADPDRVYIEESEIGLQLIEDWGPLHISSLAFQLITNGDSMDAIADAGYFGTNNNGIITFPGWSLLSGRLNGNGAFGWYYANGDPGMEFPGGDKVPAGTGLTTIDLRNVGSIEAIGTDTNRNDSPTEYFNLQGIRVENPSGGIFIERRGGKVTKRYIP